jgi:hypothetical protein
MYLDIVEHGCDPVGPIRVPREEDIVGHFTGREVDVVLTIRVGQRNQRVRVTHGDSFDYTSLSARDGGTIVTTVDERQARELGSAAHLPYAGFSGERHAGFR